MNDAIEMTIIIPVRDRWDELTDCLESLGRQEAAPPFEVVIVDDGSDTRTPVSLLHGSWPFPVRLLRRGKEGIGAARNAGVRASRSPAVLFVDSDCLATPTTVRAIADSVKRFPDDVAFQPSLQGWPADIVGRMEGLRLEATQQEKRRNDGRIAYVNTSGFALRISAPALPVFDEEVRRGEDTLLLADLLRRGPPPRFVEAATVIHRPRLSLARYLTKHFAIGYHTHHARKALADLEPGLIGVGGRIGIFKRMVVSVRNSNDAHGIIALISIAFALEWCGRLWSKVRPPSRAPQA